MFSHYNTNERGESWQIFLFARATIHIDIRQTICDPFGKIRLNAPSYFFNFSLPARPIKAEDQVFKV